MYRKYSVESYNPEWPGMFLELEKLLKPIFKNSISIEHVGSTSVPGMKAKPTIDMLVTVSKMSDLSDEREVMQELGYVLQENHLAPDSLLLYKEHDGHKTENIHVFPIGSHGIDQFRKIRDYLKAHPERVQAYENLKENLVCEHPDDYLAYRKGKDSFLKETLRLAEEEN
jgi:GrpB-like predicted nucleotidyltransferase (UPF0157 family)